MGALWCVATLICALREEMLIIFVYQLIRKPIKRTNRATKQAKAIFGRAHGPAAAIGHRRVVPLSRDPRDADACGGAHLLPASRRLRGQLLPALPALLRKPPAHHPDLLQAAGAV